MRNHSVYAAGEFTLIGGCQPKRSGAPLWGAQADTLIPGTGNPLAWDRYAYTNNNPLRYSDPSGHAVDCGLDGKCESPDKLRKIDVVHAQMNGQPMVPYVHSPKSPPYTPPIPDNTFSTTQPTLPCPYQGAQPPETTIGPLPQQPDTSLSPDDIADGLEILDSVIDLTDMLPYIHVPGPVGMALDAISQGISDAGLDLSPAQRTGRIIVVVFEGQSIAVVTGGVAGAAGAATIEFGPGAFVSFAGVYIVGNVIASKVIDTWNNDTLFPAMGLDPTK